MKKTRVSMVRGGQAKKEITPVRKVEGGPGAPINPMTIRYSTTTNNGKRGRKPKMTPEELHEFILKTQIVEFGKPLKKVKKAEMCAHFKCVESTLCKYLKILTIKGVIQLYDNGGRITLERLEDIAHPEVEAMAIHTTKHCIAVTDAMMLIAYTVEEVATEAVGSTMERMDTAGQQQYIAMLERLKEVAVRHAVRNQLHKRNVKKLMEAIEDGTPEEETEGGVYAI